MKYSIIISSALFIFTVSAFAQFPRMYKLNTGWMSTSPQANSINDIVVQQDSVWFGTERGLSLTTNGGSDWIHFSSTATFDTKGISSIAIKDNIIWVATIYFTTLNDENVQTGGGLHYSTDLGTTWFFIPQPVDQGTVDTLIYGINRIRALAITVPEYNITFDIALTDSNVWTASWAGMLRKSTDLGQTWARVVLPPDNLDQISPTDSLNFDLSPSSGRLGLTESDNHKVFSIYASDDSLLWVGTAGGINKSTDGGTSWRKFSHQNQAHPISGNFVVALKEMIWRNKRIMWAGTVNANDPDEIKGISYSEDGGDNWKTTLLGEWVHNIAVKDSIVYAATDGGLLRSSDFGVSWIRSGTIYDSDPSDRILYQRFVSTECYGVGIKGDTVWYGGSEGTAYTIDSPSQPFGSKWKIFRVINDEKRTYAYPNPFSPDDEPVRLHFSLGTERVGSSEVSIHIFDFAMHPVRTLVQKVSRFNGYEYDEIWDGKGDNRSFVVNGVYFYRVEISGQSPMWGKILVIR